MINKLIFLLLTFSFVNSKNTVNYKTWSLENGTNYPSIENAIALWKIEPLNYARVESGKGDIKIYFKKFNENASIVGYAYPWNGKSAYIYLRDDLNEDFMFYVLQHEFGHALGLDHDLKSNNTIMYPYLKAINVTNYDRSKLSKLQDCRFDSVTLINYYTYLIFTGSKYKRLDFNTLIKTKDEVWVPFVNIVDSMYRNESGSYVLISNQEFFEFDFSMHFIRQGLIQTLFPNVEFIDAVLKLRNGTTFVFSNLDIYKDQTKVILNNSIDFYIEYWPIRGAFQTIDESIQIVDKKYLYTFDKNFIYQNKTELCKTEPYSLLHCCDYYGLH